MLEALGRSLAIIEFDPNGKILYGEREFLQGVGLRPRRDQGPASQHVRRAGLCAQRRNISAFWAKLGRGEFDAREYKRIGKGGREIWIQASYNPVMNAKGAVLKVVKVATVITAEKLKNAEFEGKLNAISRVQAVIEFTPAGEVITANENFLNLLGYRLDEIKGQHHRMFVEPAYAQSTEYQEFWRKLNARRICRRRRSSASARAARRSGSRPPTIRSSTSNGKVMKVVKFATDITRPRSRSAPAWRGWPTTISNSRSTGPSRRRSRSCASISTSRSRNLRIDHAADRRQRERDPVRARRRSRRPPTICRAAPSSRPRASRRPRRRSTRSPRR